MQIQFFSQLHNLLIQLLQTNLLIILLPPSIHTLNPPPLTPNIRTKILITITNISTLSQ